MEKLQKIEPWIARNETKAVEEGEYLQTPEEVEMYRQQSMCINCMLCYAACPIYALDPEFVGPAASALSYRYIMDSRNQTSMEKLGLVTDKHGVWNCTFVGNCTAVCPKKVDPAGSIQRLKVMGAMDAVKGLLMPGMR
jgi:fumarate reductase iron-sulfur subunit